MDARDSYNSSIITPLHVTEVILHVRDVMVTFVLGQGADASVVFEPSFDSEKEDESTDRLSD